MNVYLVLMNLKYPNYEPSVNKMILIFMTLCVTVSGLRMNQVRVPQHVVRHTSARLDCQFDLEDEALYSVKWYKDGNEFYRFQPRDDPPMLVFEESGLLVDVNNSTESQVILLDVSLAASGRYRCEVSGEAPSFRTVTDHGDMLVVALPESGPHITGGKPRYQVGEWANLNCTVPSSNPAALVSWFVNGEPAEPSELVGPVYVTDSRGLVTTTLGLRYKIRPKHFKKGDMKIKCLALIGTVYSRSNEESVEGDRLQKGPALESRNAVAIGSTDSRVDRVQATSIASSQTNAVFRIISSQLIISALVFR